LIQINAASDGGVFGEPRDVTRCFDLSASDETLVSASTISLHVQLSLQKCRTIMKSEPLFLLT